MNSPVRVRQRVVQVAGLGVLVVGARQVAAAEFARPAPCISGRSPSSSSQTSWACFMRCAAISVRRTMSTDSLMVGTKTATRGVRRHRQRRRARCSRQHMKRYSSAQREAEQLGPVHHGRKDHRVRIEGAGPPAQVPDADARRTSRPAARCASDSSAYFADGTASPFLPPLSTVRALAPAHGPRRPGRFRTAHMRRSRIALRRRDSIGGQASGPDVRLSPAGLMSRTCADL